MPTRRSLAVLITTVSSAVVCFSAVVASAQGSASIGQSFQSGSVNITQGALVSLQKDSSQVVLSNVKNSDRMVGVVSDAPLVAVSDGNGSVQVVTTGITPGLVSDINGSIKTGDRIAASPVDGVGMLLTGSGVVVGTAQADLSTVQTTAQTITDQNGDKRTIHIGAVPIRVSVAAIVVPENNVVPNALQDLANGLAGKPVSVVRVLLATLLFLLLFVTVTMLLYTAIRSSIISIGRNPFSEGALRKALLQTGAIVGGIALTGLSIVYLILKL